MQFLVVFTGNDGQGTSVSSAAVEELHPTAEEEAADPAGDRPPNLLCPPSQLHPPDE